MSSADNKMRLGFWDIEMAPATVHSWGLFNQTHSLNQIVEQPYMLSFAWRWYGSKKVLFRSVHHDGKEKMIADLHALFDEADALGSWNGRGFDTKHAQREFLQAGLAPPSPIKEIDLMVVVKSKFRFLSNKLDNVAQQLGIGAKKSTGGHELWVACMAGNEAAWRKMRNYNIQDVDLLYDIYERLLPWIANHPNVALYADIDKGCPNCGSTHIQRRGKEVTAAGTYSRYQCQAEGCGKWFRGAKRLSSTAERPA